MLNDLPTLPALWECDLSDDSLNWSAGVFTLFGLDPSRPLDRPATLRLYDPVSRDVLESLRSRAIATAGAFTFEARIVRPDGAERWMLVSADTRVSDGRVTHLYGSKRDITAERAFSRG